MKLEEIVNYAKNYGFIFQGSEIYGGLANSWDYGPLGVELKENIRKCWLQKFVQENPHNYNIDSAILMNPKVWEATGHVSNFSDPLIDCKKCNSRFRPDDLIKKSISESEANIIDQLNDQQLMDYIVEHQIKCPNCGHMNFTNIRKFNTLFETKMGTLEDEKNTIYLRPETAQGMFVNFMNIQRSMRLKLPFGICQIGKSFRNEITPGNFIFRTREFTQMELEFFCQPGTDDEWFEYYKKFCFDFLLNLGIKKENLKTRDHSKEELAFYSKSTTDIEYRFPFGFGELWGIANRTDYDLKVHSNYSKSDLSYLNPETNERVIPYCIEPSVGLDRLLLAIVCDSYEIEKIDENNTREVLKIKPILSPYKLAILPLIKNNHSEKAMEIYNHISKKYMCSFDVSGSIGKRYRRADAIGTPFVITVDDNTLNNDTVTVRYRDTMNQEVIKVSDIINFLNEKIIF